MRLAIYKSLVPAAAHRSASPRDTVSDRTFLWQLHIAGYTAALGIPFLFIMIAIVGIGAMGSLWSLRRVGILRYL